MLRPGFAARQQPWRRWRSHSQCFWQHCVKCVLRRAAAVRSAALLATAPRLLTVSPLAGIRTDITNSSTINSTIVFRYCDEGPHCAVSHQLDHRGAKLEYSEHGAHDHVDADQHRVCQLSLYFSERSWRHLYLHRRGIGFESRYNATADHPHIVLCFALWPLGH